MVLSGEGADEIFGGYLYFHKAPDARHFTKKPSVNSANSTCTTACAPTKPWPPGASKAVFPSSTRSFWMWPCDSIRKPKWYVTARWKNGSCAKPAKISCRSPILWRQKEQFSDGVGYGWIDSLKELTAREVSDEQMKHAPERFPINPPRNKEEYFYRSIFEEHFPSQSAASTVPSVPSVACSTAEALAWDASFAGVNEPSGRAVKSIHHQSL